MTRGQSALIAALLSILAVAFLLSLAVGPAVGIGESLAALIGRGDEAVRVIAWDVRLPRALLGVLVGAALGASGAALQGFLRNPLAEPGLVGASSMAALGAVLVLYFGISATMPLALPAAAMAGALAAVAMVHVLAGRDVGSLSLILAGVAVNAFASAATALALNLAPNPHAALEIAFWLLGSLTDRSMLHVWLAGPFVVIGVGLLLASGRGLDALTLGEGTASSLGVSLGRLRAGIVVGTALAVGACVAVAGSIGFVGLVVPHLVRPLVGARPSATLLPSALAGAALVILADVAVRIIPTNDELRLGVLTSLIGVPFFLAILLRAKREAM